jgi:hypothetical protein
MDTVDGKVTVYVYYNFVLVSLVAFPRSFLALPSADDFSLVLLHDAHQTKKHTMSLSRRERVNGEHGLIILYRDSGSKRVGEHNSSSR